VRRPSAADGRAVAAIAANQMQRTVRDRTALFFSLVLPVVIIVVIGTTFGGASALDVGVVDQDGSAASRALVAALDRRAGLDVTAYGSVGAMRPEVRLDTVAAGIVIPAGYGAALRGGDDATIDLIADPTSSSEAAVQASVRGAIGNQAVVIAAGRAAGGDEASARTAARLARDLPQPGVRSVSVSGDESAGLGSFDYTAPSNLVLFTFINTLVVGALLAGERRQGITRRMLATPHGTGTILAGIGLARFSFALCQSLLIVVVGAVVFGVDWGDPVGAALVIVLFAAVATAVGLLVGSTARDPDQATALATPIAIGLAMLGGCMWPLEIVPPIMRTIGHLSPHAWAMDAWIGLVFDGDGVRAIAGDLAVLAGFAAVLGLLASRRLRRALTT
jgi:linearmycin/streptolysin S transport system permease protein